MHMNASFSNSFYTNMLKSAAKECDQSGFLPKLPKNHTRIKSVSQNRIANVSSLIRWRCNPEIKFLLSPQMYRSWLVWQNVHAIKSKTVDQLFLENIASMKNILQIYGEYAFWQVNTRLWVFHSLSILCWDHKGLPYSMEGCIRNFAYFHKCLHHGHEKLVSTWGN